MYKRTKLLLLVVLGVIPFVMEMSQGFVVFYAAIWGLVTGSYSRKWFDRYFRMLRL